MKIIKKHIVPIIAMFIFANYSIAYLIFSNAQSPNQAEQIVVEPSQNPLDVETFTSTPQPINTTIETNDTEYKNFNPAKISKIVVYISLFGFIASIILVLFF